MTLLTQNEPHPASTNACRLLERLFALGDFVTKAFHVSREIDELFHSSEKELVERGLTREATGEYTKFLIVELADSQK